MKQTLIPLNRIQQSIYLIRAQKVMLDRDLAGLYGIPTKVLKQAVRRNKERFPEDFMIELSQGELGVLRSQIVTSSSWGGLRHPPMAFTEQGVAMLSSVLNSTRAIQVNIAIMRTFVQLRQILATHADLARKLEGMEQKYDGQFQVVFKAIRELMKPPEPKRRQIGFHARELRSVYAAQRKNVLKENIRVKRKHQG